MCINVRDKTTHILKRQKNVDKNFFQNIRECHAYNECF